jgi:hypothetical protein
VGKVLRYKPAKDAGGAPVVASSGSKSTEESKSDKPATASGKVLEDVFDTETDKMYSAEEFAKIKKQRAAA